jgi:sulfide:quinone oxidoreductase
MTIRSVTPDFSVSPQIRPSDLAQLKAKGFRSIICSRPDGEDPGQPPFAAISAAAAVVGMTARHVPVRPDVIGPHDIESFGKAIRDLRPPVLGYCRSGMRVATLWQRSQG